MGKINEMPKPEKSKTYMSQRQIEHRVDTFVYMFLVSGAVIMIIPLVWMFVSSLKTPGQFLTTQLSLAMPSNPQWSNYFKRVWQMEPALQRGILNSLIIAVSTILVGTFVANFFFGVNLMILIAIDALVGFLFLRWAEAD